MWHVPPPRIVAALPLLAALPAPAIGQLVISDIHRIAAFKRAFDPAGTLNPGKVIPTLQRCAEYGKMHVKNGLLAFPELERF